MLRKYKNWEKNTLVIGEQDDNRGAGRQTGRPLTSPVLVELVQLLPWSTENRV